MSVRGVRNVIGGCIAASLVLSSTAASAAAAAPVREVDPWAVLTAMSGGAASAAMCGSAATTAAATTANQGPQGCVLPVVDVPPPAPGPLPGPPLPPPTAGISPLFLGLAAIAAVAGIYLAFHLSNHANSPA